MPRHVLLLAAATVLSLAGPVMASPPGLTPKGSYSSQYHAVPPLPEVYSSPMPSLPPPVGMSSGSEGSQGPSRMDNDDGGYDVSQPGFKAYVGADGSIDFGGDSVGKSAGINPLYGVLAVLQFGATDSVMRALGEDPYLAQKLALLNETFDERVAMRQLYDERVMHRALSHLPRYLDAVWDNRAWSAAERRRILFALWDEAAEEGNELLVAGGERARTIIESFIRRRMPEGSGDGFDAMELAELNRLRTSHQRFLPYRINHREPADPPPVQTHPVDPPLTVVSALRSL